MPVGEIPMSQRDPLRDLVILEPCHVAWEEMKGDDRVRHCEHCQLDVHNFLE